MTWPDKQPFSLKYNDVSKVELDGKEKHGEIADFREHAIWQ
jgi:hypothetical protein